MSPARIRLLALVLLIGLGAPPEALRAAEPATGFRQARFGDELGSHAYSVYVPPNYSTQEKWPVVLFLHGAGERGTDGDRPTRVGLGEVIRQRKEPFPAIVVFPQAPLGGRILKAWSPDRVAGRRALAILEAVEREYRTDPDRRVLTGWSMGGYGVWQIAAARPELWSAVLPIAGGGGTNVASLKDIRLWAVHGETDEVVRPEESRTSIEALRKLGGHPGYTEIPTGHASWQQVYAHPDVQAWMLSPSAAVPAEVDWNESVALIAKRPGSVPFHAAYVVPSAVGLRMGNDVLTAIAHGLPGVVPADSLKGMLEPIVKTFDVGGQAYRAEFSGLSYGGRLSDARLRACGNGQLDMTFDLEQLQLRIAGVHIHSDTLDANAGPIDVVLGHQRPVSLNVRIRPVVEDDRLRLIHQGTAFTVADDNWYVTRPASITRRGTGLSEYELTTGIVGGVYLQKETIEKEIRAVVPRVLERLEKELALEVPTSVTSLLWPLPVQAPRLRMRPEQVRIDDAGLTVIATGLIGSSVACDHRPRMLSGAGVALSDLRSDAKLAVMASPALVEAGSAMQVEQGVARINVLDLPEPAFHALARPDFWPDLKPAPGEELLDVELEVLAPMRLELAASDKDSLAAMLIAPASGLTPCRPDGTRLTERTVRFRVEHRVRIDLRCPDFLTREMQTDWDREPLVTAEGADSETQALVESFRTAWVAWTQSQSGRTAVQDFKVGDSCLRVEEIAALQSCFQVHLDPPPLRLVNDGRQPFGYRLKNARSYWSEWRKLDPGRVHEYSGSQSFEWKGKGGRRGRFLPGQEVHLDQFGPRPETASGER